MAVPVAQAAARARVSVAGGFPAARPTMTMERGDGMNQRVTLALGVEAFEARRFRGYTHRQLDRIEALEQLAEDLRFDMRVVSQVLPFRVNESAPRA